MDNVPTSSTVAQNVSVSTKETPPPVEEQKKTSGGPIIATIIIIVLLILSGLYFWGAKLNETTKNSPLPLIPGDVQGQTYPSNSIDSVTDISKDIQDSTAELDAMDAEVDAALKQMDTEIGSNH